MKKYHFDKVVNRRNLNSYKWDVGEDELPMWVADMDFDTAPEIKCAIQTRLNQGALGYNTVPDSFFESYISWWERRHGFTLQKEWLMFCTGAVPAISSIVRKMTKENDKVVLITPVYNIFYNSILNNGREVLESRMLYEDGKYSVDYEDLENKLAQDETTLMIFCNPHNPTGYVWTKAELEKIGQLCLKHDVLILSDEVHCDLTHPGSKYTPFASVSEAISNISMTCMAPSKAFNIAGLQTSVISVPNETLRKQVNRGINTDEVAEPNSFAIQATEAAFNDSEGWLDELNRYLATNRAYLIEQVSETFPNIKIVQAKATYLAWLDCSAISQDTTELCAFIRHETGLILSSGEIFGGNGKSFIRWNYACPLELLIDGVERFKKAVRKYSEQ